MRFAAASRAFFNRKPASFNFSPPSLVIRRFETSSTTTTTTNCSAALTEEEVNQINDVIPRLCSSNHLKEAVQLISAALSTANPPVGSLPLSILINRLALEPDLTHPMHLLNSLKYNSNTEKTLILLPITKMFASYFFRNGHPKRAVNIFQWVSRPDFPGGLMDDLELYAVLIDGFCRNGMILDGLRVLRVMASGNLVIGSEIRLWVYRGLLREARVNEALELNAAFDCGTLGSNGGTLCSKEVVDLLDRMITNWVD
ncbi:pentatricopeptide repeat-containing protein at1g12775 mitochondrial [Phtheirospermum japonicum]|uniref:Pentatricopeptide repeat-containing protein at1g12775 mitochondrial n=1 Tax=Phtheirospermum japonicum TaxID=374723 RepID=A0A830BP87_9LAMI|nr:pentatricopeptide repeat-containing protein at1g12775 mitochondrial [Phtheirospermum japonicum]